MDNNFIPAYDESKEIEIITNFHKSLIWRVNTTNSDIFLKSGFEFDKTILANLDEKRRCRLIYVVDKVPPLTAILRHIESPFDVDWAVIAIVINEKSQLVEKINPIISYGLGLTKYKNKFVIGVFNYIHRNNLEKVIKWMDSKMEINPDDQKVTWFN